MQKEMRKSGNRARYDAIETPATISRGENLNFDTNPRWCPTTRCCCTPLSRVVLVRKITRDATRRHVGTCVPSTILSCRWLRHFLTSRRDFDVRARQRELNPLRGDCSPRNRPTILAFLSVTRNWGLQKIGSFFGYFSDSFSLVQLTDQMAFFWINRYFKYFRFT